MYVLPGGLDGCKHSTLLGQLETNFNESTGIPSAV